MGAGKRVLLVEDDPDVSETLAGLLARFGYDVTSARDGVKAMRALRGGHVPDVIVLDLMMPNMDGYRFRDAQSEDPVLAAVPTIVITADRRASKEKLGVAACLRKPFDIDELLAEIGRQCQG